MIIHLEDKSNQAETLYTALKHYKAELEEIALDDGWHEGLEEEVENCDAVLKQLELTE